MGPHIEDIPQEVRETPILKEEKREIIETVKEDVDETVILARLRTQAKVLQELDGELPESVDKFLSNLDKVEKTQSLSLVAGYGEESDEETEGTEELPAKILFPIPEVTITPENATSESTLFPITKPIDITQFTVKEEEKPLPPPKTEETSVDTKVFKRKKRIAFDVLPTVVEKKSKSNNNSETRLGFGFKPEGDSKSNDVKPFISFQKGGLAFVKSDNLLLNSEAVKLENFDETKDIVREKVEFLSEGKNEVSAVQIISIQLDVSIINQRKYTQQTIFTTE